MKAAMYIKKISSDKKNHKYVPGVTNTIYIFNVSRSR